MRSYRHQIRIGRTEIGALRFTGLKERKLQNLALRRRDSNFQSKRTEIRSESSGLVRDEHATLNAHWEN